MQKGRVVVNNERGITLLEVLAAVAILSVAMISFSLLFGQNFQFSHREERRDVSVNIARTVIEELKGQLPSGAERMTIFEDHQEIDLALLREPSADIQAVTVYYPSGTDRQFTVVIRNIPIPADKRITIPNPDDASQSYTFPYHDFFSHIEVEVENEALRTSYSLQSYVERRGLGE